MNSFYADLAQFESKPSGQIETMIVVPTPEIETAPKINNTVDAAKNSLEEEKEIVKPKKKKKVIIINVTVVTEMFFIKSNKIYQILSKIKVN